MNDVFDDYNEKFGGVIGLPLYLGPDATRRLMDLVRSCIERGTPMTPAESEEFYPTVDAGTLY